MEKIIFKTIVRLRRLAFFRVTDRTLMMLMPLAVVGSIFQFLWQSVFSPTSLISNIFYFDKWLPDQIFNASWYACQGVTCYVVHIFGVTSDCLPMVWMIRHWLFVFMGNLIISEFPLRLVL